MDLLKVQEGLLKKRTKSELRFAELLTERGVFFKEQEIILGYFLDFYFPEHDHRIVELDGEKFHDKKRDAVRDGKLRQAGCRVLRVRSSDVFWNTEWLMHRVLMFLKIPHEKVSRSVRRWRRKAKNIKPKGTPKWAKVPRLTKDHLPTKRRRVAAPQKFEFEPSKPREVKVIKNGR